MSEAEFRALEGAKVIDTHRHNQDNWRGEEWKLTEGHNLTTGVAARYCKRRDEMWFSAKRSVSRWDSVQTFAAGVPTDFGL